MSKPASPAAVFEALRREVTGVLESFEAATGLHVCVRPLIPAFRDGNDQGLIPPPQQLHPTPFCVQVKRAHEAVCRKWDLDDLPALFQPGQGPLVRTCHAGANEVIVPLWRAGGLAGVVFIGQFRRAREPRDLLPRRSETDVLRATALGLALRSYLLDLLERCEQARRASGEVPEARIEAFFDEKLSSGPRLGDLARHLSLSLSRTSHLVRELTGKSFRQLKEERTLWRARHLLESTPTKIAWVARQCGFPDANYFCRYFRRCAGMTPTEYRRQTGGRVRASRAV